MTASRERTVLVTDAGRGSGLAFVRSLSRAGYRVVAADSDPRSLAFRSRHAHEPLCVPDPARSPDAFCAAVFDAVEAYRVDLVIPVTDEAIHPLAHRRDELEARCALAIGPREALAVTTDKERTLALARELGVALPATRPVVAGDRDGARRAAAELTPPFVIKPSVSRRYLPERDAIVPQTVAYARDGDELLSVLERLAPDSDVLLQEYVAGEGHGVGVLAHGGRTTLAFQHRRLAEIPVTGGASAWRESVALDPRLLDVSRRIVAELSWNGLIMIEFKVGERAHLMEINGRAWGSLPLAVQSGLDLPVALARLMLDGPPEATDELPPYRTGVRTFNLDLAASWVLQVLRGPTRHAYVPGPRRRDVLPVLAGLLDVRQRSDIVDLEDPLPGLAQLPRIARKLVRKVRGAQAPGAETPWPAAS